MGNSVEKRMNNVLSDVRIMLQMTLYSVASLVAAAKLEIGVLHVLKGGA